MRCEALQIVVPVEHTPGGRLNRGMLNGGMQLGEGGIRTHETRKSLLAFEASSFDHSDTSPCRLVSELVSGLATSDQTPTSIRLMPVQWWAGICG